MTFEVVLSRKVDLLEYRAVLEVSHLEKRDDILAVLMLAEEMGGSVTPEAICKELLADRPVRAGQNIIHRCNDLGLLRGNRLAEKGRDALKLGQVPISERSSYRLTCTLDPLLPQVLLDLVPEEPHPVWRRSRRGSETEGDRGETADSENAPRWLQALQGKTFQLLGRKRETVQVDKVEGKVVLEAGRKDTLLSLDLVVSMSGQSQLLLKGKFEERLPGPKVSFRDVWKHILGDRWGDWVAKDNVLLSAFDELSESSLTSFTKSLSIERPEVPKLGSFRNTVIRDVAIAPKSLDDAQKWAEWLLVNTLREYMSEEGYDKHSSNIGARFPRHRIGLPSREELAESMLKEWSSQKKKELLPRQYWFLRAPADLNPRGD